MSFKIAPAPSVRCAASRVPESGSSMSVATPGASFPAGSPPVVRAVPCDPAIDACARTMGGDNPAVAYAAAMLWYRGYPDQQHREFEK